MTERGPRLLNVIIAGLKWMGAAPNRYKGTEGTHP